jgi:para-aminobenzoate synthetase
MANQPYSVWLDGTNHHQPTQCSILTCYNHEKDDGGYRVEYYGKEHEDHVRGLYVYRPQSDGDRNGETIVKGDHNRKRELCKRYNRDILSFLQREHSHATNHVNLVACLAGVNGASAAEPVIQRLTDVDAKELLPFDFRGGHVGYLGYEVRHDIESRLRTPMNDDNSGSNHDDIHNSNHNPRFHSKINNKLSSAFLDKETTAVPTAAFLFAHQSLVYDPNEKEWYMVGVLDPTRSTKDSIFQWFKNTEIELQHLATTQIDETSDIQPLLKISLPTPTIVSRAPLFETLRCKAAYQRNIAECREFIRLGESYELCLTNQFVTTVQDRDEQRTSWDLYQILRRRNPAPFSAYLNWNSLQVPQENRVGLNGDKRESARVAICCSSPERFVSVQRQAHDEKSCVNNPTFIVEAKPIKGTCARVQPTNGDTQLTTSQLREDIQRAEDLQASIKNRAENLMIVDLLRNDLSRVCRIGSVHVPKLMHTESYTTVHQLVSTIRGALDEGKTAVDVLETCFPGGSMTGAPKLRTLELLDQLEEGLSRGPYSGCLGYISLNGSMDMNIIIRSAVVTPSADNKAWNVSIGAGGAITALSDVDDEYDEMVLKAKVVMEAVQKWADHHCCRQRVASSGAATLTERSEFLTRG